MNENAQEISHFFRKYELNALAVSDCDIKTILGSFNRPEVIAKLDQVAIIKTPNHWEGETITDLIGVIGSLNISIQVNIHDLFPNLIWLRVRGGRLIDLLPQIRHLTHLSRLDLSRNHLTALPPEICQLTQLSRLYLSRNQLTSLSPKIGQLTQLSRLDLSGNQLTALPPEIRHLTQLHRLYLSGNKFKSLPPEIWLLRQLIRLNISNNQFTILPAEVRNLNHLVTLVLVSNRLAFLPPEIGQLPKLAVLNLSRNQLTALPPEIGQLTHLTTLDLSVNQLTSLPSEIGQLIHLTTLSICYNKFTNIAGEIGQLARLSELNLSNNQLIVLPSEIGQLSQLINLHVSNNRLKYLPSEIGQLTHLTNLQLANNQISILPPEIGHLTQLTKLHLSYNQLTALPPEIGQLTQLTNLELANNPIMTLPPEVGQLTQLTQLHLSNNQITKLPSEVGRLTKLTTLDLSRNRLTSLPPEIGQLTQLTTLDLSGNRLTSLPPEIGQLTQLTTLELAGNRLTSLPPEVGQLTQLTILELAGNPITSLPSEIGQLSQLTKLSLSGSHLVTLPSEVGQLTQLTSLSLSGSHLITLPSEIGKLTQLTELHLSNNKLTVLPSDISQLTQLSKLWLSHNQLSDLPLEITRLNRLTSLDLRNNCIDIPPEILEKVEEPQVIFDYLVWAATGKKKPLNETKILVVGQGSVGKTSLIKRLLSDQFNPGETKTEGIAVNRWQIERCAPAENQATEIILNIWDFGGQEIMHATHQFFLTKRSLYLLVLDARLTQEENRVEYWLKIIQSFGADSPVVIVGNKCDQHPLDIDRSGLRQKYSNIVAIVEASAATGSGISELKAAIEEQVNRLPHVSDLLPEVWFTIKAGLEAMPPAQNFITYDEYTSLCRQNRLDEETGRRTLIGFLHDLGVVLYFQDDPRLESLGILNPQWVTNGVYRLLNSHALFHSQGVLTLEMLDQVLDLPEYPRRNRLFIVDMMRKFELCYVIEPENKFLVPDLLPKDEPYTGEWQDALAFQVHYTVLPSSIMSRFIVRMNAYIHKTVWRSGVVLKMGGNTALVKADTEDRKIFIWVGGATGTRRDMLSAIRAELEAIRRSIAKIEAREKVPVPDHLEVVVDYEHLLNLDQLGEETFIPEGLKERISVREMLNGVSSESERHRAALARRDSDPERLASAYSPEPPLAVATPPKPPAPAMPEPKAKLMARFHTVIKWILLWPKIIGRLIFDLFGRKDTAETSDSLLGWGVIVFIFLMMQGIISLEGTIDIFKEIWRFFFPTGK